MDITKDIAEAIQKNLPAAVGDQLQAVLAKGKADAIELSAVAETVKKMQLDATASARELERATTKLKCHEALKLREEAADKQERELREMTLKVELAAEKRISDTLSKTLAGLVRNTEWRESIHHSEAGQVPMSTPGGYSSLMPVTTTTNHMVNKEQV